MFSFRVFRVLRVFRGYLFFLSDIAPILTFSVRRTSAPADSPAPAVKSPVASHCLPPVSGLQPPACPTMDIHDLTRQLFVKNDSKIVMYVADGLGGLPQRPGGLTELETASTPNLDKLVREGVCGGSIPVAPGIAPGSGPGHLGLFGYDPVKYLIGRGALEATGIGFKLEPGDVAIRANFCTVDASGNITDRRAGRIASEESAPLAIKLREVKIPNVEIFVEPVKE